MGDNLLYRTELAVRRAVPEPLKAVWRAARLLRSAPPAAPELPAELLDECRVLSTRMHMLDQLGKGGVLCELGTQRGLFAKEILARTAPRELHLVDITFSLCDAELLKNPVIHPHEMMTTSYLATAPDAHFDMVYVDADHSYEAVRADAAAAASKVKPGGLLAFNDFARIIRPGLGQFGVHQAVCEFMVEHRWPMAFFCMNGEALYDVALRRPLS
jgi:SAM-dependent methyltransferase